MSFSYQSEQFIKSEEFDSAAYYIGKALEADPLNHVAYNNRGHLYFMLDSPSNVVIREYERALEIKPGYYVALYSLANYYFEIHDYPNTITATEKFFKEAKGNSLSSEELLHLKKIKATAVRYTELINGISVYKAEQFFKTITDITTNTTSTQNRLVKKLGEIAIDHSFYKGSKTYRQLGQMLENAISESEDEIKKLKGIEEVDSEINLKSAIEKHCLLMNKLYKTEFRPYLFDKEHLGILGIRRMLMNSQPLLAEIKAAEIKWMDAKKDFKEKYKFDSIE